MPDADLKQPFRHDGLHHQLKTPLFVKLSTSCLLYSEFQPSKADLEILREWIKKTPHVVQDYDDEFLAAFVRGCKGSLQKTKSVLENFNALGYNYPEFYGHLNIFDPVIQEHLSVARIFPLPKKTEDGSTVFLYTQDFNYKGDPYKFHSLELFRYWMMTMYIYIWENNFGSGKVILFTDGANTNLTMLRDFTPVRLKNLMDISETSVPVRTKAVHHINLPPFIGWAVNYGKAIAKKKIIDRLYFHNNLESLHQSINKDILPKEYGGSEEDLATLHERWKKKVESYSSRLIEESHKMRKLDHIRPKKYDKHDMVGTFRSLNVD